MRSNQGTGSSCHGSEYHLLCGREWSHAAPDGERQQDAGVARRIEAQQQRPWTAANVQSGRPPFTVVRSHGSQTAREHISSHRVGQTHDELLEHLELRKVCPGASKVCSRVCKRRKGCALTHPSLSQKNVRADSDGVVLLPDSFTRLGSARYGCFLLPSCFLLLSCPGASSRKKMPMLRF